MSGSGSGGLPVARDGTDRCLVMGVLNVTPDSFSDGGRYADAAAAVEAGRRLWADGADVVDVGGESTRPGAERVPTAVERARVVPVVSELAAAGVTVSVDTMRASVASAALDAGAAVVNDVSGGLADAGMLPLVAERAVPYVAMHWRGHSVDMQRRAAYDDVVDDVAAELERRLAAIAAAGVDLDRVVVDPGLGFAKTAEHSWALLAALPVLRARLGRPLLVGASRKGFLGALLADARGPRPPDGREAATVAVTTAAALAGAWAVRVHEVAASVDAVRVAARLLASAAPPPDPRADPRRRVPA